MPWCSVRAPEPGSIDRETLAQLDSTLTHACLDLGIARVAGIMAAKKTSDLVPLCHPIALTRVALEFRIDATLPGIDCEARTECLGPTGVEMEALAAVQIALLTIYDMCKAVDRGMVIEAVRLIEKRGGKSGEWRGE